MPPDWYWMCPEIHIMTRTTFASDCIRWRDLAIAISVAMNRSRSRIGRSSTLRSHRGHRRDIAYVHPIRGASFDDDVLGTVEPLLSSAPFCVPCLVTRTNLRAWDVEIAMRALLRTSDVELAGVCESCLTRSAFRARHRGATGS
jgi:hypothetical protein